MMAALARQRVAGRARVEVADLEQPLGMVPDACIGLVVASLVLHYVKDWRPLLAEPHRGTPVETLAYLLRRAPISTTIRERQTGARRGRPTQNLTIALAI